MRRSALTITASLLAPLAGSPGGAEPWPAGRAWAWYESRPWLVGCNFLPSTAVNDIEMWQAGTFDRETIDRELSWAHGLGFTTVRVFLNAVVWEADPAGLRERFGEFLGIAGRHGIAAVPVLFDDCNFAGRVATAGPQPAPVPGVHNSQWVSSPPLAKVADRAAWPRLRAYVEDLVGTYGHDPRVAVWDLYNEPGNSGMRDRSLPLLEAAFEWARAAGPSQPLTAGAWSELEGPFSQRMMALSDVVSFHCYGDLAAMEAAWRTCARHGRPVLCTEWMARTLGSRFGTHLEFLKRRRVGCWSWGLVTGRTQTCFPWGSPEGAPMPAVWFHDLFRPDGSPWDPAEAALIRALTGAGARPSQVASGEQTSPVPFRGDAAAAPAVSAPEILVTPPMTDEEPGPGRRVRQTPPEYQGTEVHHALYLPVDWRPGGCYPVLVEYTGNAFPACGSTGRVGDANLGYGLTGGRRFIWVTMPCVETARQENALTWWGDRQATIEYCKVNLPRICDRFGGDPANVFLCGFSRGAIAVSYIGLADDAIAALWKGFFAHDHFDGQREWPYPESDRASALARLARLRGRPVLVSEGEGTRAVREYLEAHRDLARFTFLDVPVGRLFKIPEGRVIHPHTDLWMCKDSEYRRRARQWLDAVLAEGPAGPPARGPAP